MGTTVHICTVGDDRIRGTAERAHQVIGDIDAALSRFLPTSDVTRLNEARGEWLPVSGHFAAVARAAERYRTLTDGVFDTILGSVSGQPRLRLRRTDGSWQGNLAPSCRIDFGAIAKGYAADAARALCQRDATGVLVSLGTSSISLAGAPRAHEAWRIALRSPWVDLSDTLGYLEVPRGSFSMSGLDGHRLGSGSVVARHIVDPRTGNPVRTDLCGVGVLSADGMLSEALSTACIVLGVEQGLALCRAHRVEALFLTAWGEVVATPPLSAKVALREGVQRQLHLLRTRPS